MESRAPGRSVVAGVCSPELEATAEGSSQGLQPAGAYRNAVEGGPDLRMLLPPGIPLLGTGGSQGALFAISDRRVYASTSTRCIPVLAASGGRPERRHGLGELAHLQVIEIALSSRQGRMAEDLLQRRDVAAAGPKIPNGEGMPKAVR